MVVLLLMSGCAGENARDVALTTLKAVAQYEKELDRKINAEKAFYKRQSETLRAKLAGTTPDPSSSDVLGIKEIKKTWLYGYIRTSTDKDARRTAGDILSRHPSQSISLIMDFVARGIEGNRSAIAEIRTKQAELAKKVGENLAPVNKQKNRLASLRKGLTTLAVKPDTAARLKQVKAIAKIVAKEIEKGEGSK